MNWKIPKFKKQVSVELSHSQTTDQPTVERGRDTGQ